MKTRFMPLKVLTVAGMMTLAGLSYSNDGKAKATVKEIQEATATFEEESLPSQTAQMISGKKDAIKKVETTFKYSPSSIYEIWVSPDYSTRIELNPDEDITYVGGGDTTNWKIDMSKGGEKSATSVYIRPVESDIKSNLIIQTTKRTYTFLINGDEKLYNIIIKFTYPIDAAMSVYRTDSSIPSILENGISGSVQTGASDIRNIVTNYKITPTTYDWSPVGVYNDGKKTYIKFKETMSESPILVVKGSTGKLEEVNYHQEGNVIRIDRVVKSGQLKLDKKVVKFELK